MKLTTTTWNRSDLYVASISDIHLAHPRTSTYHIIENLRKAFPDDAETAKLDLLLFAGDVFDRLMNLPQDEVDAIQEWIADLLKMCAKHQIAVRVLEGTPSHDWRQSKQFVNVNNSLHHPADLKYVDTLSIEVFDRFDGLSVLYVPDEWNADAGVTLSQVRELLTLHGMEQVDIACMHGSFDYQLPIESVKNHDSAQYMALVRYYIVIGHVHIRSELGGKILAQGSFDRLSHGEEAAKGHYRFRLSKQGQRHWFVENPNARIYMTLDCRNMTTEAVMALLESYEDLPLQSRFRLLITRDSVVQHGIKDVRKRFPQFILTTQMDELKLQEQADLVQTKQTTVKPITITSTNVGHLVSERLKRLFGDDPDRDAEILRTLEKYSQSASA